jgi:hypothetical protein
MDSPAHMLFHIRNGILLFFGTIVFLILLFFGNAHNSQPVLKQNLIQRMKGVDLYRIMANLR